jgi:hypothetical protein
MRSRFVIWVTAVLAALPLTGIRAEVRSLTLGITMNCPYGLAG